MFTIVDTHLAQILNTFKPKTSWVVFTTDVGPKTCVARSTSKANVFEVLAYWAQCDPRIKLQRTVNKTCLLYTSPSPRDS